MPKKTKESDNKLVENIKNYLLSPIKPKKEKAKKNDTKKSPSKAQNKKVDIKSNNQKATIKNEEKTLKEIKVKDNQKLEKAEEKKAASIKQKKEKTFSPEYYDLPYKYNKTVVKILAQTPTNLFVYWEISDEDREKFKKQYGEYFFEITKPVLVIHNLTMNYSFEININDFANSWYFHVNDSSSEYKVELGRRPISVNYSYIPKYDVEKNGPINPIQTSYVFISSSNNLEAPNDHILFNNTNKIYYRNVKTNQIIEKDIKDFPFIVKDNDFVNVNELYKKLYKDEISNGDLGRFNPSSGNPSSGNLSSW